MRRLLTILLIMTAILQASAQMEGTQYFMSNLPQVVGNNPAFIPKFKFSVGLPVISGFGQGYYNNGFTYNDVITKSNGQTNVDLSKWGKALTGKNYITNTQTVDLFRLGLRINPKLYLQANITAFDYTRVMLPREFTSLLTNGNAQLIGTTTHFSPQATGLSYVESAVGAAYQVNERLTVGARLKYLSGIANLTTVSSDISVGVGSNYQISAAADIHVKTSGVHDMNVEKDIKKLFSNPGYGMDLGATYKLTEKLILAASIVDFGKISWKNDLYAYTLNKSTANYTFSGTDLQQVVIGNNNYLKSQGDSIQKHFKPKEGPTGAYSTWIPGKMYLSGMYELKRSLYVGALLFTEKFQGRLSPGASASLIKYFGKWMSTSVSYSVSNRSYNNIGAGLSFNFVPFQLYVVGDNLLRLPGSLIASGNINPYVNSTQVFNLRVGLNIVWGWDKGKLPRNTEPYNGKANTPAKQKVTDGNPTYLKVRKKKK